MSDHPEPQRNLERLLEHLEEGSLAAKLVEAYRGSESDPSRNMKTVLEERLKKLKENLAGTED